MRILALFAVVMMLCGFTYGFKNNSQTGKPDMVLTGGVPSGSGTSSGTNTGDVTIGTANGLSLSGQALSLQAATNSLPGALTAADHATLSTAVQPGGALGAASATSITISGAGVPLSVTSTNNGNVVSVKYAANQVYLGNPTNDTFTVADHLGASIINATTTGFKAGGTLAATNGASTNHTVCWKSGGVLGYCSTVVASDGTCTCN